MKVSGKIIDQKGETISCANVNVFNDGKQVKIGTYTNLDGYFCLESELIKDDSLLEITYNGLSKKQLKPSDLQETTITLNEPLLLTAITDFGLPKKQIVTEKTTQAVKKVKSNFNQHFFSHKEKYAIVVGLLGIIIIFKSLKK
jgi:hypothetical protein